MEILAELFKQHRNVILILMLLSSLGTWVFNNVVTVLVGELQAPTATSTEKYKYWFRVLNKFVGNKQRANSTSIENSPNFLPAVEKLLAQHGLQLPPAPLAGSDAPPAP